MPYVWVDPPGPDAGWVHEVDDVELELPDVVGRYPIPADNDERRLRDDAVAEGARLPAAAAQAARTYWGVTVLHELPTDLPSDVVRVAPGA